MLDVSLYLEQAMEYLLNQDLEGFNKQFMYQKEILNSQDFNYTMKNIETNLEILYEKSRLLEALIAYAEAYVKANIYNLTDECESILRNIEDNVDSLKTKNYISTTIEFENSIGSYKDRDGTILKECAVYDNKLTLNNEANNFLKIKNVTLTNNLIPYKNNIKDLIAEKQYRSFYLLDAPVTDGLKEEIYIEFETPSPLNHMEIITSNCELVYLKFHNENGTIDYIEKDFNIVHSKRTVKAVTLILKANNYKSLTYYVDESRAKPNYFDTIKDNIFKTLSGGTSLTQSELDELTGMKEFKKAYDTYCFKIENWIEERKAIMNTNKSNGYNDEIEKIDFIVAPDTIKTYSNSTIASNPNELTKTYGIASISSNIISTDTSLNKTTTIKNKFYPDVETMKYQQAYVEALPEYISKTGKPINMYLDLGKQEKYTNTNGGK